MTKKNLADGGFHRLRWFRHSFFTFPTKLYIIKSTFMPNLSAVTSFFDRVSMLVFKKLYIHFPPLDYSRMSNLARIDKDKFDGIQWFSSVTAISSHFHIVHT